MRLRHLGVLLALALVGCASIGAGSASATVACKSNVNPCPEKYPLGTKWHMQLQPETVVALDAAVGYPLQAECTSSEWEGELQRQGLGIAAEGPLGIDSWGGCSQWYPCAGTITMKALGNTGFKFLSTTTGNGELRWLGTAFEISSTCAGRAEYTIAETAVGKVTGGKPATVAFEGIFTKIGEKSLALPAQVRIRGSYTVNSPTPFYLQAS